MSRFTLEGGADALRAAFTHIERHDRRAEIVCPEVEPVMRYLSSLTSLGMSPERLAEAERAVADTIQRDGVFRVTVHVGAFICR